MKRHSNGVGFCAAAAVIAAAVADPIVEFCSNAGYFGSGALTDHSNLDVVPAFLAGAALLAFYMVRKARAILEIRVAPSRLVAVLPAIFALQILTLYTMETGEQLVVWGHTLGAAVWLGGPLPISLAIHAAMCLTIAYSLARSKRMLAATTLRVIGLIRAIATFAATPPEPPAARRFEQICFKRLAPVLCAIGERAPPAGYDFIRAS